MMRSVVAAFFLLLLFQVPAFATLPVAAALDEPQALSKPDNPLQGLTALQVLNLSARDFEAVTGRKMNLLSRLGWVIFKGKLRRALRQDPDLQVEEFLQAQKKNESTFKKVLLILLALAAVVAIIILEEKLRNR